MNWPQGEENRDRDVDRDRNPWNHATEEEEYNGMGIWVSLMTVIIGSAASTYALHYRWGHRTLGWIYSQVNRAKQSNYSWRQGGESSYQQSNRTREEACNRYNQRMKDEYEEEMERVERIRRMQGVFNRERSKYKKSYEKWHENASDAYQQHNFQREDWYWKTDKFYQERKSNGRKARMQAPGNYALARHHEVLGLDVSRAEPYSEAEIKAAFRLKAKEYHPDQNPTNKEAAEEMFKQVMISYEALKLEQKNK